MKSTKPPTKRSCMLTKKTPSLTEETKPVSSLNRPNFPDTKKEFAPQRKTNQTRIVIKYDAGFGNQLFIRGKGSHLNWDKGIPLKNVKADEWIWETETSFNSCEFKILINDSHFELGENHLLDCGSSIQYTPKFF
jgi:hypothetical protein